MLFKVPPKAAYKTSTSKQMGKRRNTFWALESHRNRRHPYPADNSLSPIRPTMLTTSKILAQNLVLKFLELQTRTLPMEAALLTDIVTQTHRVIQIRCFEQPHETWFKLEQDQNHRNILCWLSIFTIWNKQTGNSKSRMATSPTTTPKQKIKTF